MIRIFPRACVAIALIGCKDNRKADEQPRLPPSSQPPTASASAKKAPKTPGRVVVLRLADDAGSKRRLELVDADGHGQRLERTEDPLWAIPYDQGRALLLQRSKRDHTPLFRVPVGPGKATEIDWHMRKNLKAVNDTGTAVLLSDFDLDDHGFSVQLLHLASGEAAGIPVPNKRLCLTYGGDVSPSGDEAIGSCAPCGCVDCDPSLCRLRVKEHAVDIVRASPPAHYTPAYSLDGRVMFSRTADGKKACYRSEVPCPGELVAVPQSDLAATPTVLRRAAHSPRFSRAMSQMAYIVDAEPCRKRPCQSSVVVAGLDGREQSVLLSTTEPILLPPRPFSLDGIWLTFTLGESPRVQAKRCRIADAKCEALGAGEALGWVR